MPFPGAKGTCYDPGIHVPLLVRWPGVAAAGTVDKRLISHVDLAPTWVEMAGARPAAKMQGRSFAAALRGGAYTARPAVFSERNWHDNFDPIRSVRTERYKLIFNAAPHFPYRPALDLEQSPSWASYLAQARRGALAPQHLRLLQPSRPMLEMYDLQNDPDEFVNIIDDPAHAGARKELLQRLGEWMHQTYDYLPPAFTGSAEPRGRGWPLSL